MCIRDRNLSLNYWGFTSAEEAIRVSELSINRISVRQRFINGIRQSIYQPETCLLTADCTWRAERNILFARSNILILVSESGQKIELAVTIDIAQKILNKIVDYMDNYDRYKVKMQRQKQSLLSNFFHGKNLYQRIKDSKIEI